MAMTFIKTKLDAWIEPGQTHRWWWNNAAPRDAVWSAQAVPFATGDTASGFAEDVSLEVTRVWRRLIVTEKKPFPQSQTVDVISEDEIHYEVKNIGNRKSRYAVFLSVIS